MDDKKKDLEAFKKKLESKSKKNGVGNAGRRLDGFYSFYVVYIDMWVKMRLELKTAASVRDLVKMISEYFPDAHWIPSRSCVIEWLKVNRSEEWEKIRRQR